MRDNVTYHALGIFMEWLETYLNISVYILMGLVFLAFLPELCAAIVVVLFLPIALVVAPFLWLWDKYNAR